MNELEKSYALDTVYPVLKDVLGHTPLCTADKLVTALLEKGIIVPVCKVGAKVYIPDQFGRIEAEIDRIEITEDGIRYEWAKYDRGVDETELWDDGSFESSDVGKTVFLSFEEYEKVYGGSTDESSSEEY